MNLDFNHPNGEPKAEFLKNIPYIRVEFKCRRDLGESIADKIIWYKTKLAKYNQKIILILTHRSGFEGRYKRWEDFSLSDWLNFANDFVNVLDPVFREFSSDERVEFQIWNEPEGAYTGRSVLLPPSAYFSIFAQSRNKIKEYNTKSKVITAGFKSGADFSYKYFKETGILNYDGFALHLYLCGARKNPDFKLTNNNVEDHLDFITSKIDLDIYLTEFGVLDHPTANVLAVEKFTRDWIGAATNYRQVKAICWYPYGIGMDNGYGLGTNELVTQQGILNALSYSIEVPIEKPIGDHWQPHYLSASRNFRKETAVNIGTFITTIPNQSVFFVDTTSLTSANGYWWVKIWYKDRRWSEGREGWIAIIAGG